MPTYIICSTDTQDFGKIEHIDLEPHFSALNATVAVTNVNTLANFQVLTDADYINFTINGTAYTLHGKNQQGMSWESISGVLNTIMRNDGQTMTSGISDLHRLMFSNTQAFSITGMTYNFEVMLGFIGHDWEGPINAVPYDVWMNRKGSDVPYIIPEGIRFRPPSDTVGFQCFPNDDNDTPNHATMVVEVLPNDPNGQYAVGYNLKFEIAKWEPSDLTEWCVISDSGTVTVKKDNKWFNTQWDAGKLCTATIKCKLFIPNLQESPRFTIETKLNLVGRKYLVDQKPYDTWTVVSKDYLLIGELARIGVQPNMKQTTDKKTWMMNALGLYTRDQYPWEINQPARLKFIGAIHDNGTKCEDNGWSAMVQAGNEAGPVTVTCYGHMSPIDMPRPYTKTITIVNDQIPIPRFKAEAPSVGTGISTSQLYLMSNIGTDLFRNSIEKPRLLENARIAAIINNSFSAGYPVLAGGEPPIQVATMDLSNLSFRLVDGNFKPLKLLNPMYITMQISPVDVNPVGDITSFQGKLPKDKPTPRELQKAREEELQQQVQQAELAKIEKQKMDSVMSKLNADQQLQFLALHPDKQEFFRMFNEEMDVEGRLDAEQQQQLIQRLAQTAPERMSSLEKVMYYLLPWRQKTEMVAQRVQQEAYAINSQAEAQRRQELIDKENAEVQAKEAEEKEKADALQAAVDAENARKQEEEAKARDLQDELDWAPVAPA